VVEEQKDKFKFWINNGRTNHMWQTAYHDRFIPFANDRYPITPLELNPEDAAELGIESGDIVEVYNNRGASFALAYVEPAIKRGQAFMMFGHHRGIAGDLVTEWVDENIVPYYKGAWADIRKVGVLSEYKETVTFKSRRYV
ncbi:MAG: molybdopterin dinucleotide binding domain-containing protein, partial [Caldilinea sp.]